MVLRGESQIYKYLMTEENTVQLKNQDLDPPFKSCKYLYNSYKCGDFKLIKIYLLSRNYLKFSSSSQCF